METGRTNFSPADNHDERLEGFAAAEMADRGPKDIFAGSLFSNEQSTRTVNGALAQPDDEDDIDDEDEEGDEDDLILGDEDELDEDDLDEDDIDVEVDDDLDEDDIDEDDLVLGDVDDDDDEDEDEL